MRILSKPKGNAEEYGRWSVNPYVGCPHGCTYCYLKKGVWANTLGGNVPTLKAGFVNEEHAYHVAMSEIIENREQIIKDGGLFMTFTSDPCINETRDLFFAIVKYTMEERIPVMFLTKSANFTEAFYYENIRWRMFQKEYGHDVSFGWTLTGHDEQEPNAFTNEQRIKEMERVHRDGFKTWASIEPVIDFYSSFNMVERALNSGCKHFKIGLLTCNTHVVRKEIKLGEYKFDAYKREECIRFINNVMELTEGLATVYWKNSFVEFLGSAPIDGMTADEFLHQWPHSVDKNWRFFKTESEES